MENKSKNKNNNENRNKIFTKQYLTARHDLNMKHLKCETSLNQT